MLRDDEFDLVVRTVLGEAAGESPMGQAAVAHVIRNRLQSGQFGKNARDVLFAPKQFEPWGSRRAELMAYQPDNPKVQRAAAITQAVFDDRLPDPTEGATHFYGPRSQRALGRAPPRWDDGTGRDIGGHRFFKFASGPGPNTAAKASSAAAGGVDVGDVRALAGGAGGEAFPLDLEPIDDVQIASGADQKPPNAVPPSNASSPVPTDLEPITDSFEDHFAGSHAGESQREAMRAGLEKAAEAQGRPTQGRSALLGLGQGVTANFLDEAAGGVNAAVDYVTGQAPEGFGAAYAKRRDQARSQIGEAERANPATFLGSQVAGGVATAPALPLAKAPVVGGALYGAVSGAGAGEGAAGAAAGAGLGAIGGAAIGAVAPAVINAAGRGLSAAGSAVAKPFRTAVAPGAQAEAMATNALVRDARAGKTMSDEDIDAAMAAGQPLRLMDIGGEATRGLARSTANVNPEARQTISDVVNDRYAGQGERITEFVQNLRSKGGQPGANATRTREELQEQAAKENKVNYDIARGKGRGAIWDPELAQLAQAPAVQTAIRESTRRGANRAAIEGHTPVKNPFTVSDDGVGLTDPNVAPNLEYWDIVQRGLKDQTDTLLRQGAKDEARDVIALRKQLLNHLDNRVPEFKVARAGAAAAFGEESALDVGVKLIGNKMPIPEIRRLAAKFKPAEKELFAEGYASALVDKVRNTSDRQNAVNRLFAAPAERMKAEVALGKGGAGELEAFLRRENMMDAVRGALGNSTTARQMVELAAYGGAGTYSWTTGDPKAIGAAALYAALKRGNNALNDRVAKRVADLLVSDNPELLRKATNTIARNARVARAVKDAEETILRAAAPAATSAAPQTGPLQLNGP